MISLNIDCDLIHMYGVYPLLVQFIIGVDSIKSQSILNDINVIVYVIIVCMVFDACQHV